MVQSIKNMIQTKIDLVKENINVTHHYINSKSVLQDWPAVASAVSDIRELNAQWKAYDIMLGEIEELENQPRKKDENEKAIKSCDLCRDTINISCPCR
jgi:hypothetical protein